MLYRPIPRDRDQAFSNFDGNLFNLLKFIIPDVRKLVEDRRMSRFPVSKTEYLDDTVGVIYVKDLFDLTVDTSSDEIEKKIKDVIYLPESTSVLSALNTLRERKASFACVIDVCV